MTLTASVAIVGGGLAGLHAAGLLEQAGICDVVLLESRSRIGGRLLSLPAEASAAVRGRFDLGATWVWPGMQAELGRLLAELGLDTFEQPEAGDLLVERRGAGAPARTRGWRSEPASMRVVGGMVVLVAAAKGRLYGLRQTREARAEAGAIQQKNGSRKSGLPPTAAKKRRARVAPDGQGQLF